MRRTVQRQMVAEALHTVRPHPTCDDICGHIRASYPGISIATVYRILGKMTRDGEIRRVPVPDGADRFDKNPRPHYHIRCLSCGEFADIEPEARPEIDSILRRATGYTISPAQDIAFEGVCPACVEKEAEN